MDNTGTPLGPQKREKHIYSTIAAHFQYYCSTFYSIIAAHLQHYCSTFTALLQYIYSIIAAHFNSSTITTHLSTVTAYSSTFTALLQYIYSIIAAHFNSSTITTHFSTVTAYSRRKDLERHYNQISYPPYVKSPNANV